MARRGRKRNFEAPRHECGKIVQPERPERESEIRSVGVWNNAKQALEREMVDPRWGSELGRLHYQGRLFDYQREAGERLCRIIAAHRKYGLAVGDEVAPIPSPNPKTSRYGQSSGGEPPVYDIDRVRRAQDRYDEAFVGVVDSGKDGVRMWKAVTALCIDDEHLVYSEFLLAKKALDRLSVIFGLITEKKADVA